MTPDDMDASTVEMISYRIRYWCHHWTGTRHFTDDEREDLAQEVWLEFLQSLHRWNESFSLGTFAKLIFRNVVRRFTYTRLRKGFTFPPGRTPKANNIPTRRVYNRLVPQGQPIPIAAHVEWLHPRNEQRRRDVQRDDDSNKKKEAEAN